MKTSYYCIERPLKQLFYRLGKFVARYPLIFLLCPVALAAILACGMFFMTVNKDSEYLFTPENGLAKVERKTFSDVFPADVMYENNMYSPSRHATIGIFGQVIITAKNGESVLRPEVLEDVVVLDRTIRSFSFQSENGTLSYNDVCAKYLSEACSETNIILMLINREPSRITDMNLTFPLHNLELPVNPFMKPPPLDTTLTLNFGPVLGNVSLSQDGYMESASAMRSFYSIPARDTDVGHAWEDQFLVFMNNQSFTHIEMSWFVSRSIDKELDGSTGDVSEKFMMLFNIVIIFSILSCVMVDWVLSKPWLGSFGVMSTGFAVVSSYGLLMFLGLEFVMIAATVPFLTLAIGVDDMFVLLASWRRSDPRLTIEKRMGQAFQEGGVAILITTITDFLGFMIGALSVYPSVRVFCLYMGVAILFDFLYQITFFGACMVLTGRREHGNRHAMFCHVVKPPQVSGDQPFLKRLLCKGGFSFRFSKDINKQEADAEVSNATQRLVVIFRDSYAPILQKTPVKIFAVITFLAYLSVSIWGCTQLKEGIRLQHLALDGSYVLRYFDESQEYFRKYYIDVGVLFDEKIDYSSRVVLRDVDRLIADFEKSGYFYGEDLASSWLHAFWKYVDNNAITTTKDNFYGVLQTFLQEPASLARGYLLDVKLDKNSTHPVLASRIYILSKDMVDSNREKNMMLTAREIASDPKYAQYNITVYSPVFYYYDQFVTVVPSTLQTLGIVAALMLVVSLLLIPDFIVSAWVFLSIVSICTGVVGFMTFWDVNLDSVAMINLITSVGFSVDFSAHIAYAFSHADGDDPNARMASALASVGLPITQGATSTLVGVALLGISKSYIIRTFFKIMFLVIIFGYLHAMLFLPIFLSMATRAKVADQGSKEKENEGRDDTPSPLVGGGEHENRNGIVCDKHCTPSSNDEDDEIVERVSTV